MSTLKHGGSRWMFSSLKLWGVFKAFDRSWLLGYPRTLWQLQWSAGRGGRNLVCPNNFDNSRHSGQEGCDVGAISSELSALEASWYFAMISIGNQRA